MPATERYCYIVYSTDHFDSQCITEDYSRYEQTYPFKHTMVVRVHINVSLLKEKSCNDTIEFTFTATEADNT